MSNGDLTLQYLPLLKSMTSHAIGSNNHDVFEEALQVAILASLEAEQLFDPSREVRYHAYVKKHVKGALMKHVQGVVPKQNKLKKRAHAMIDEYMERGEVPTIDFIAQALHVQKRTLLRALQLVEPRVIQYDDIYSDNEAPEEVYEDLYDAIGELSQHEQELIHDKYFRGVEGISTYHLNKILDKLRKII